MFRSRACAIMYHPCRAEYEMAQQVEHVLDQNDYLERQLREERAGRRRERDRAEEAERELAIAKEEIQTLVRMVAEARVQQVNEE